MTALVPSSPSIAEVAAVGSLCFAVVSWGIGRLTAAFRRRGLDAADEAATDATVAEQLKTIQATLLALTAQITKTNDNHVLHEKDCAKFRGETVTELRGFNKTLDEHGRHIEQMQSQIRMVVTGGADHLIEITPRAGAKP